MNKEELLEGIAKCKENIAKGDVALAVLSKGILEILEDELKNAWLWILYPVLLRSNQRGLSMFTVEYRYYNYPMLEKTFDTYAAAKGFFWKISKAKGVKKVNLIGEYA